MTSPRSLLRSLAATIVVFGLVTWPSLSVASTTNTFTATISGTLDVAMVDGSGNTVSSPTVAFAGKQFLMTGQTTTGTLGISTSKIRVTNPSSTAAWSLTMAATSGNTTTWSDGSHTMDFNDSAANGRLTVDASGGTLAGVGSTSTSNITKGSSTAFAQGTTDSITLLTASASAAAPGQWDFTGVSMTQDIPAMQATGNYSISMTLTVS